ncbi:MAG: pantoate--beta-alanine ligase, partial [Nitrospiria bacterium]
MKVVQTVHQMRRLAGRLHQAGKRIGMVPTMGALHEGHLSLIRVARKNTEAVVVSIFVNPPQFGPTEDFMQYPRDSKGDKEMCRNAGVDILFMPPLSQMYTKDHSTFVTTGRLTEVLCGPFRPGHFQGVTTVVTKLFNIVRPHLAFFGQKDYQQALVIRQMAKDLHMEVKIVIVPTVRDADGLAVSSRNVYLSAHERRAARVLYQSLPIGREMILRGERDARRIQSQLEAYIRKEPLARVDYVSISNPQTLQEVQKIEGKTLIALAVWIGKTRLIDNIIVRQ